MTLLSVKLHLRDRCTDAANIIRGVCPSVCHESQRRRHGVMAVIIVDTVAMCVCPSIRFILHLITSVRLLDGV